MKIRTDFVTNSSSSSFIVVTKFEVEKEAVENQRLENYLTYNGTYIVGQYGNCHFDRCYSYDDDFNSKINYLTLIVNENEEEREIIAAAIKNAIPECEEVDFKSIVDNEDNIWDAWIDHADDNRNGVRKLLRNKDALQRFLLSDASFILYFNDEDDVKKQCQLVHDCIPSTKNIEAEMMEIDTEWYEEMLGRYGIR